METAVPDDKTLTETPTEKLDEGDFIGYDREE